MNMERNIWIKRTAISVSVASALLSQPLIAQEKDNALDTMVIKGKRASALDIEVSQEQLEKVQASDLKDIFKSEAEVNVGGSSSVSQKVYVRGLETNMLNVTIDGAKQSASTFHHQGSLSIEPELLKKVSVQAGAGSALNGPGALGGSLQFKTKDPDDLLYEGERFGGIVKGGYNTNANAYKTSLSLYGTLNDNWSAMATVVQTEADDYEDGRGNEVEYTDYNQQNALIKLVGHFKNDQRLSVSFDNRIDDGERLIKPNWTETVKNSSVDMEAHRKTGTIEYSINPEKNQWLALETNAYYTENNIHRVGDGADGQIETYGFDMRNTSKISDHTFTYGVDYQNDKSSYGSESETSRIEEGDVYGVYLQAEFQFAQAWLLNVGSRYDTYHTTDADNQHFKSTGFSPNASIQFTPLDNLQLALSYAQAMRGVEVRESYLIYEGGYTNAADLKEERAENIEFSIHYQHGGLGLSANVYHSTVDDVITYGEWGEDNYTEFNNDGELINKGVTLGINYNWESLQTSVSYNHNTVELNGEPLGGYYDTDLGISTGDTINTSVNYQLSHSLEFGWSAHFATRLTDTNDDVLEKAGYGIHDVYGQWLPLNDDSLKVTLSISNLFDKNYRDQSTFGKTIYGDAGDMAPGRDFRANVAWAF